MPAHGIPHFVSGQPLPPQGNRSLPVVSPLDGSVIGQCMQRHRHQEFIRFLNRIERDVPAGKLIHVILDTGLVQPIRATHKHRKVRTWLERREI